MNASGLLLKPSPRPLASAWVGAGQFSYLAGWPDERLLHAVVRLLAGRSGLPTLDLPDAIRIRRRGDWSFAFNYGDVEYALPVAAARFLLGAPGLAPGDVAIWR